MSDDAVFSESFQCFQQDFSEILLLIMLVGLCEHNSGLREHMLIKDSCCDKSVS